MTDHKDPRQTPDESGLPTTPNAQSRSAYFEDMLPGVVASDERDDRLVAATKRRRAGIPLTVEEVRRELKQVLTHLTSRIMQYDQGFSTFLRNPTHALDYAERVAAYAIKDYPREMNGDAEVMGLWNTLNRIHTIGYAWRKGDDKSQGKAVVESVNKIALDSLQGIYPNPRDEIESYDKFDSRPITPLADTRVMASPMSKSAPEAEDSTPRSVRPVKAETQTASVSPSALIDEPPENEGDTPKGVRAVKLDDQSKPRPPADGS